MPNLLDKVKGFSIRAVKAGIKKSGNLDMGLIVADEPAATAAVFTKSKVVAAPVTLSRKAVKSSKGFCRAILVNAGIANACSGDEGMKNALESVALVSGGIGCKASEVLVCSTGTIGHQLPMEKMRSGIAALLSQKGGKGADFVKAILTTDLVKKEATAKVGKGVISGVCKGSGMIAPNMATMLAYILTDVPAEPAVLQQALKDAADMSFNCVTVDGDTSTNDTLILMSSGKAGGAKLTKASGKAYNDFCAALQKVCYSLATQIARDGEGATKLVRVVVNGAKSMADAHKASRTVAESPLVKTAMFGNDPNWGRIIAALGRSGCAMKEEKTTISLCGKQIFKLGNPQNFDAAQLSKKMAKKEVEIVCELGMGKASKTALTCDFSYDYVKINAEYHT